jgi:hypothetical protein
MQVSTECRLCLTTKLAETPNGPSPASTVVYSGAFLIRVFCPNCGIQYAPESIGCKQLPLFP